MKVAVLFDNFGPYHTARLTASSLVAEILAVEFGASSETYSWSGSQASQFRHVCINPKGSGHSLPREFFRARLNEALSEFSPDAVAVPGWSNRGAFAATAWCHKNAVPMVVMSDSNHWDASRNWVTEWVKRRYLRSASAALVAGRSHADYLAMLGVDSASTFVGYDVVDNSHFQIGSEQARRDERAARLAHGLPDRYFLACARFVPKKNLFTLIRAYASYRAATPKQEPVELLLLGNGEQRAEIEKLAEELGIRQHLHLPGFRQYHELPIYYGLAEAFIQASTIEQWGLVVNEATASGLPVIVSDRCGCAAELVQPGVNGFTFDPARVDELAALLTRVAAADFPRSEYGRESQRIIAAWGPERFASSLLAAAEKAVEVGAKKISLGDRLLIEVLCRR